MKTTDKDIVSALWPALVNVLGQDRFDLWFLSVTARMSHGILRFAAPDTFTRDRLAQSLRKDIERACASIFEKPPRIEFEVDGSLLRPSASSPVGNGGQDAVGKEDHLGLGTVGSRNGSGPTVLPFKSTDAAPARRYARLESFIVGDSNRIAFTSAQMIAQQFGAVTPFFVYGPTGTGKTHLLQGLWTAARAHLGMRRVVYVSAEEFTSQFLGALQGSGLPSFRRRFRDLDVLLIDDVQFFSGKRATLVELQHTIDALLRDGKQLAFAADRPPVELDGLGPDLAARMSGGVVSRVDLPDQSTRHNLLRSFSNRLELSLSDDVCELLSAQLIGDARQLNGALHRLQVTSRAESRPITRDMVQTVLADVFRSTCRVVCLPDIERAVCDVFGLETKCLQSENKSRAISQPRMLAMWLARKYTRAGLTEIGDYFGGRSHSTVISAHKKIDQWMTDRASIELRHGPCGIDDALRRVEAKLRTG